MHRAHVRRTAGAAALLPALLLAALYIAAPFAGTTTHAISRSTPTAPAGQLQAVATTGDSISQPVHISWAGSALHTMGTWYAAAIALALVVIVLVTAVAVVAALRRHHHRTA